MNPRLLGYALAKLTGDIASLGPAEQAEALMTAAAAAADGSRLDWLWLPARLASEPPTGAVDAVWDMDGDLWRRAPANPLEWRMADIVGGDGGGGLSFDSLRRKYGPLSSADEGS